MEEKRDQVQDPESGLEVRYTDNGPKPDDPIQIAPDTPGLLELDENGVPFVLREADNG